MRILVLGAHPDDADIKVGGTAARWCDLGYEVILASLTDGGAGHQTLRRPQLVERRRAEASSSAKVIGATYRVMDLPDGELMPTLEARQVVVRLIREVKPDLLITHRPTDYHPDHRCTAQLVRDAAYMVTVPAICPKVPHLMRDPVILYMSDAFKKPCRFEPSVIVDIEPQMDKLISMLDCHVSQFYEWLPYNMGIADQVPEGAEERKAWLGERMRQRIAPLADRHRDLIVRLYGEEVGGKMRYVEAFEVSEYGAPLDAEAREKLFPFVPAGGRGSVNAAATDWVDLREDE